MLTFACQWGGFAFEAQLTRNTTHLLCFQHSGAKWEAARRWAAESIQAGRPGTPFIVNHRWLVDCLSAWEVLPPGDYSPFCQHRARCERRATLLSRTPNSVWYGPFLRLTPRHRRLICFATCRSHLWKHVCSCLCRFAYRQWLFIRIL